jgi:kynurenine formamidase
MSENGNWGRWGPRDERGTLNLLSDERVLAATQTPRSGRVITLGLPVDSRVARLPGRPPVQHFMTVDGADFAAGSQPMSGRGIADDALVLNPHGTTTHADALAHVWADGALYNGHPQSSVHSWGATRCGIDRVGAIVTRGVLLDLPATLQADRLLPHTVIDAGMLEASAARAGLEVQPTDAVLFRTGAAARDENDMADQAGLDGSACRWLAARDVSAVGSDNAAIGPLVGGGGFHVSPEDDAHLELLWRHGIILIEMLDLSELAAANATTFLFVVAPLRITGGTASPVNPIAIL